MDTMVNKTPKKDAVPSVFDWSEQKTPWRLISRKVLSNSTDEMTEKLVSCLFLDLYVFSILPVLKMRILYMCVY